MLKEQIITNTWKCDKCGTEVSAIDNPNTHVTLSKVPLENSELDLCYTCLSSLTDIPVVVTFAAAVAAFP